MVRRLNYELRVNGFIGSKFFVLNRFRDKEYEQIVKEWNEWCVMLLELQERYSEKKLVAFKDKAMEICKRERVWMEVKLYN